MPRANSLSPWCLQGERRGPDSACKLLGSLFMWRLTKYDGITQGSHPQLEVLQRQAYGFRNFNNWRLRV